MAKKRLYYRIDFVNTSMEYDYTICAELEEINQYVEEATSYDFQKDSSIEISAVMMTEKQYDNWIAKHVEPE